MLQNQVMPEINIEALMDYLNDLSQEDDIDLKSLLEKWGKENLFMDKEEALLRLLYELSKEEG